MLENFVFLKSMKTELERLRTGIALQKSERTLRPLFRRIFLADLHSPPPTPPTQFTISWQRHCLFHHLDNSS